MRSRSPAPSLGLVLAALLPATALPTVHDPPVEWPAAPPHRVDVLHDGTGLARLVWEARSPGRPPWIRRAGLAMALLGIWAWCGAILHKTWTLRRGVRESGSQYLVASMLCGTGPGRCPRPLGAVLSLIVMAAWLQGGHALGESAVVDRRHVLWRRVDLGRADRRRTGPACRSHGVWGRHADGHDRRISRLAGRVPDLLPGTLHRPADRRAPSGYSRDSRDIAFGPYLCLAAVIVVVGWNAVWTEWASPMFSLGWFIPVAVGLLPGPDGRHAVAVAPRARCVVVKRLEAGGGLRQKLDHPLATTNTRFLPGGKGTDRSLWDSFRRSHDLQAQAESLRRHPYGVIVDREGRLRAVHLRPWPKVFSPPDLWGAGHRLDHRTAGDVCWLYYNQPCRHRRFLALKYIVSSRRATFRTFRTVPGDP